MQYRKTATRIAAGLSIVAAGAWAAGTAGAAGEHIVTVSSATPRVGCTYTVETTVVNGALENASFTDNGEKISGSLLGATQSAAGDTRAVSWTPTTAGTHTITAHYSYLSASVPSVSITVQVAPSDGTGSASCGVGSWLSSLSG